MNSTPLQPDTTATIHHHRPVLSVRNRLVAGAGITLAAVAIATGAMASIAPLPSPLVHGCGSRGSRAVVGRSGATSGEPGPAAVGEPGPGSSLPVVGRSGATSGEPGPAPVSEPGRGSGAGSLVGGASVSDG